MFQNIAHKPSTTSKVLVSQLHPLHLPLLHKHLHVMYTTAARSPSASSLRHLPPRFHAAGRIFVIMLENHRLVLRRTCFPVLEHSSPRSRKARLSPVFGGLAPQSLRHSPLRSREARLFSVCGGLAPQSLGHLPLRSRKARLLSVFKGLAPQSLGRSPLRSRGTRTPGGLHPRHTLPPPTSLVLVRWSSGSKAMHG